MQVSTTIPLPMPAAVSVRRPAFRLSASDPRLYQITFLMVFLGYGILRLEWDVDLDKFAWTFGICLLTQLAFTAVTRGSYTSLLSAVVSSLSLCLILKANAPVTVALAAFLSIAEKFIFRAGGKHFFNPTNFGICTTILVTGNAWISSGQWGNNALHLLLIGLLGMVVLIRVRRFSTALAFLCGYVGLLAFRHILYQGWPADFLLHQLQNGTFLLFTFFMITDPVSTPAHPVARWWWAFAIGVVAFVFQSYYLVNGSPLWALFLLSPLTPVLDKLFQSSNFKWKTQ
jgi:Na+-transporting NADH:ubiquinone oxidoreductase subunit NqrB